MLRPTRSCHVTHPITNAIARSNRPVLQGTLYTSDLFNIFSTLAQYQALKESFNTCGNSDTLTLASWLLCLTSYAYYIELHSNFCETRLIVAVLL
jgi:hypothetical protein